MHAAETAVETQPATAQSQLGNLYIREYRVRGNKLLKPIEIEEAVYPFMGPGRSENDIEQARLGWRRFTSQRATRRCTSRCRSRPVVVASFT
jgi:hemolysin activation/secretion protein